MIIFICLAVFALFASYFVECYYMSQQVSPTVSALFLVCVSVYFFVGFHVAEDENRRRMREQFSFVSWGEYVFIMIAWPFFVDEER